MLRTRFVALFLVAGLALSAACTASGGSTGTTDKAGTTTQTGNAKTETSKPAASEKAQEVTVDASEFSFKPAQIEAQAGTPVKLTLKNDGQAKHDWTVELGSETVQVVADPGQTKSVTFTPQTAGTYEFICAQPGHEPAGMKGSLVVK